MAVAASCQIRFLQGAVKVTAKYLNNLPLNIRSKKVEVNRKTKYHNKTNNSSIVKISLIIVMFNQSQVIIRNSHKMIILHPANLEVLSKYIYL